MLSLEAAARPPATVPAPMSDSNGHMAPLPEEDEPNEDSTTAGASVVSPSKTRNRASVTASSILAPNYAADRPPPPLPSLKCGDETAAGSVEPLVDEISCALREWTSLLYTHLYRRDYALFHAVRQHIEELHVGRRQLLANTLSLDELASMRRECVERLVKGNVAQGLDVIVRHPSWGGLVDVEVEGEIDQRAWVSGVKMYEMQVALAYGAAAGSEGMPAPSGALSSSSSLALRNPTDSSVPLSNPSTSASAKFHHVHVDLRAFVASPCAPGETSELAFSLYNKAESRFLTEEFCVILNHQGVPLTESRLGKVRTLFKDLSAHDLGDQIFLVCKIVKNGNMKLVGNGSNGGAPSTTSREHLSLPFSETDSYHSSGTYEAGSDAGNSMLHSYGSGGQSFRRPFGCAVLDISLTAESAAGGNKDRMMPVFVPVNEASFSTLHEDIIASRIREFEKSPRAQYIAVGVRIFHGEAETIVKENPSICQDAPLTSRLGFPDVVFPNDSRNEVRPESSCGGCLLIVSRQVYVKLWSGQFDSVSGGTRIAIGGAGAKNIEVSAEVRRKDGSIVDSAISRGTGERKVSTYSSLVFRSNNSPSESVPLWVKIASLGD
jgi:dedicator of cytokinesis protein 3